MNGIRVHVARREGIAKSNTVSAKRFRLRIWWVLTKEKESAFTVTYLISIVNVRSSQRSEIASTRKVGMSSGKDMTRGDPYVATVINSSAGAQRRRRTGVQLPMRE